MESPAGGAEPRCQERQILFFVVSELSCSLTAAFGTDAHGTDVCRILGVRIGCQNSHATKHATAQLPANCAPQAGA